MDQVVPVDWNAQDQTYQGLGFVGLRVGLSGYAF